VTSDKAAQRLVKLLAALERAIISALMAAITILTLVQVVWRYGLNMPLQWSEEIARYCFVWVTFLGAAALMRLPDGHPVIDAVYLSVGAGTKKAMELISRLVVIVGTLAIAIGGLRLVLLQWRQLSPSVEVPMTWIYLAMFVGPLVGIFWVVWCARHGWVEDEP
jgi:TRAP-type C4-dicarboxylate transport system permease small subunit